MANNNPYFNLYLAMQTPEWNLAFDPEYEQTGYFGYKGQLKGVEVSAPRMPMSTEPMRISSMQAPSIPSKLPSQFQEVSPFKLPSQPAAPAAAPAAPNPASGQIASQAIMGGLQLASDIGTIAGQRLNLGTPQAQYFAEGVRPTYQGGEYMGRVAAARPQGATGGEILGTAGKAAATGASIGSLILPGVGTAIGAGIGALVGGAGAAIGGGVRKRAQGREKDRAMRLAKGQQQEFNVAASDFAQREAANYKRNPYRRLQNLYQ